jgi:1-phosphatidylinositol phosphodiesterase
MRALAVVLVLQACGTEAPPAWMAGLDDTQSLAALSIPGTHDSGALFEPLAGLAKTQDLTIAEQLAAGVRYFDVRCRHFDDGFLIYHGAIDQNQTFDELVATMYGFLDAHPTETLIASIKEEAAPSGATRPFDATFADYVSRAPERWYLEPQIPTLGAARGKLVLLRRFDTTLAPLGLAATAWPDNVTFTMANPDAAIRVQDEYAVTDNAAKWTAIEALLTEARSDSATLYLDYTSGFQTMDGLSNITLVSDEINARLDATLAALPIPSHVGVLVMDHVTAERVAAVIATNGP